MLNLPLLAVTVFCGAWFLSCALSEPVESSPLADEDGEICQFMDSDGV